MSGFQDLSDMTAAWHRGSQRREQSSRLRGWRLPGNYATEVPVGYFEHLRSLREEKRKRNSDTADTGSRIHSANDKQALMD